MPYIDKEKRRDAQEEPLSAGELNYNLSQVINKYLSPSVSGPINYSSLNEVIGVLECLKMEVYRRIAAPYEDKKMEENGDVFTCITKEGKA